MPSAPPRKKPLANGCAGTSTFLNKKHDFIKRNHDDFQDVNTLARSVPERLSVGIQSVEIGVALLKLLADAPGPMPLAKLAELAGMPRSKAHKYLASRALRS